MSDKWIADRMHRIDASGIRKVFDLAATMKDPINLSIGQPHFDTPQPVKDALCDAVQSGRNAYSQTQGIAPLLKVLQEDIDNTYKHSDRQVFVTSGTSGALMLALCTLVNPGDEVIIFDPWFVMYKHLVTLAGGTVVQVSTYPDFRIRATDVEAAITDRTKVILFNSPANPTGAVASQEEVKALADLAAKHDVALISDEIYKSFCYDGDFYSPASFNDQTIVIDGFSKSHSMTGHRLGYMHGPRSIVQQMMKLQQFTFVCAPHPVQWAGLTAWELDLSDNFADYHRKRDLMVAELQDDFEIHGGQGAFYLFLKAPWGTGTEFVTEAIRNNLLIIPGNVFSPSDTHFRLSFAAEDETLRKGAEVLRRVARQGPPTQA
ncbi:pyridoxal phosphate-dependent aminotransferase [Fuerstiella marisgermanici]|uniref:Aminotransferase n=1 Tax=Fuerstiella marisgermanici TaxID=1891926 RepID=A0A1P8W9J8_9PLAN|nr:aminotransferase class I/II-fold pyridoxal phosphate-dependent enzyme [Fuerstiella marisgermanici]APZ90722.1 Aspartate aminotransferase [Fuerstiella marisgermanici]